MREGALRALVGDRLVRSFPSTSGGTNLLNSRTELEKTLEEALKKAKV